MRIIHNVLNKYEQLDFLAKISLINEKLDSKLYGRNINILFDVYFGNFFISTILLCISTQSYIKIFS